MVSQKCGKGMEDYQFKQKSAAYIGNKNIQYLLYSVFALNIEIRISFLYYYVCSIIWV